MKFQYYDAADFLGFGENRKCFEAAVGSMKELWGSFWNYRFIGDLFWQEIEFRILLQLNLTQLRSPVLRFGFAAMNIFSQSV